MAIPNWISLSQTSGHSGTTIVSVSGLPNTGSDRLTFLTVKNSIISKLYENVTIVEVGGEQEYLDITPRTLNIPITGGTYTLYVAATVGWNITYPTWITGNVTSGIGSQEITIQVSENTSLDRSANITVTSSVLSASTRAIQTGVSKEDDYLTLYALSSGQIGIQNRNSDPVTVYYQFILPSGAEGSWTGVTISNQNTRVITANEGTRYRFKANDAHIVFTRPDWGDSGTTINYNAFGDVLSLIYGDDYKNYTTGGYFEDLFSGTRLKGDASHIKIPQPTIANQFLQMFTTCSGMTKAPALPYTTLTEGCYREMFSFCHSLTEAPELPATALTRNCYNGMFDMCTSLTKAPDLLAPTLVYGCYYSMFAGCSNMKYIKCLATDRSASYCTSVWTEYFGSSGTFVKASGINWPTGRDGIPEGWTVQEI